MMQEIRQKTELRRLLIPSLTQSLNILALPLFDLREVVERELENNPLLEEAPPVRQPKPKKDYEKHSREFTNEDLRLSLVSQKASLQEYLLRQLGMFSDSDEDFRVGEEIIGNIDENGYLAASLEEISKTLGIETPKAETVLRLIQGFDPPGIGGRTIPECLLIQLGQSQENNALLEQVVRFHLDDVAKKNYSLIAKKLKVPLEEIEPLIKKILKLDPKPGRNFTQEDTQRIIPDIFMDAKDEEEIEITINNEDIPALSINKQYRSMLKDKNLPAQTKEFLQLKLSAAMDLLRSISRRQVTLRKIVETVARLQQQAICQGPSHLKPLTFKEVAQLIDMHETTVCRAVMNKYVRVPYGIIALKDLFPSHLRHENGHDVSSSSVKAYIKELIEGEDKKHPLSDHDISERIWQEKNIKVCRRTVTKYREQMRLLSSTFRKER